MLVLLAWHTIPNLWFSQTEREIAMQRILADGQGRGIKGTYKLYQVLEAVRDPATWLLALYTFCANMASGGLPAFGSLVISDFGYDGLQELLIQMPAGTAQLGFVIPGAGVCSWIPNMRRVMMACVTMVSLMGMVLMYALDSANQAGQVLWQDLPSVWLCQSPCRSNCL
ncbi:hypothetical protein ETB97_000310 [Aspergillus alliaceus]|uniref:Uncharacterized protein n=1 Tax=Petromyces alliaceus TaxID=209559 RepID=A0A8H6A6F1_PETAA|nr:hypothetical protein ETB97_000310 [Aspergillus burnettii]